MTIVDYLTIVGERARAPTAVNWRQISVINVELITALSVYIINVCAGIS